MSQFEITIRYEGSNTYLVSAESSDEAEEKAKQLFYDGDNGYMTGSEYEDVIGVDAVELDEPR